MAERKMIYFDNNATTPMPLPVIRALLDWANRGNPSSSYTSAQEAKTMMSDFRAYLASICGFSDDNSEKYEIIFTSGASEANCTALHMIITAYREASRKIPHVVASAIEHKSIFTMLENWESRGMISLTLVNPDSHGHIQPSAIEAAIRADTCLVCVMCANNETGAINNVAAIGAISHRYNIPFHCDAVQSFGKYPFNPIKAHADTFSVSFHKLHGPPGVGALFIKKQLLDGYEPDPIIFGTQNDGLRGGTENLLGIGAAFTATKYTMDRRESKNNEILRVKQYIIAEISRQVPSRTYTQYVQSDKRALTPPIEIVFISEDSPAYLCNTILLSVVKRVGPRICNSKIKKQLESQGIVISVGSACNTASKYASHVLYAMDADELIRAGALRISLGDESTTAEADKFISALFCAIGAQCTVPNKK